MAKSNTWSTISFHTPFNSAPLQAYYQLANRDESYPNYYNLTTIIDWFSPTSMNVLVKDGNNGFFTALGLWYASGF